MTSLPVLHLKATSRQNMTITADPYETTATLYTFLRSIPSVAETELAFQPFVESLHVAPSSGRGALLRKPNHRLVQLLEAVAVDDVFRHAPQTLPAQAAHSDRWRRRLGYRTATTAEAGDGSECVKQTGTSQHNSPREMRDAPGDLSSSSSSSPSPHRGVVPASALHSYADPYTAYEAQYAARTASLDAAGRPAEGSASPHRAVAEEHQQYSGSTQPPEEPTDHPSPPYRSYLSAEVSALTAPEAEAPSEEGDEDEYVDHSAGAHRDGHEPASSYTRRPPSGSLHPVLELIARQVEQAAANPTNGIDSALASPAGLRTSSAVDGAIQNKISSLTSRLAETAEDISAAMHEKEANEDVWSPYYSRLKTSMSFIEELHDRLGRALSLYQLQRYERETLQQARVAVQMEALTLKLVLRDVAARLTDAEDAASAADDAELVAQLHEVLVAPEGEEVQQDGASEDDNVYA